ncbi:FAS1 domain-containing protein [Colletotrichum godetiae]|uniref:FAS1 domain-containing protein n=1 Tax=Colletotrichum godetiae TaxID=1209918 RepID=A0AAJ0AZZ2_9PEZI|nr:FAS1 domain-containing protein [Colletotrichum godetiae]KAK1701423.1 FAS1 domain-containing protein [Colletotrichum godetiae]
MKLITLLNILILGATSTAVAADRNPLSYAPKPAGTYVPPKTSNTTTLLDFINSRSDLTALSKVINGSAGFTDAFDTTPTWDFTFFAPSNAAFEKHTGQYFNTFTPTPKGKWWLGNLVQHHYVPNSQLLTSVFNETATRIQTGSYLYVGTRVKDGQVWLNDVAAVTEGDLRVTKGIVHIIDHVLDPSAQLFEADKPKAGQKFIAGSCSDTSLPYC